jgi:UDP-glucose 4-epimerase
MKVLVVGGAGYVGSHTVKLLQSLGHDVWVYDNLSRGHRECIPNGMLIQGNLTDRTLLMR